MFGLLKEIGAKVKSAPRLVKLQKSDDVLDACQAMFEQHNFREAGLWNEVGQFESTLEPYFAAVRTGTIEDNVYWTVKLLCDLADLHAAASNKGLKTMENFRSVKNAILEMYAACGMPNDKLLASLYSTRQYRRTA